MTGRASPCHLYHCTWQLCGLMHGDDFVFAFDIHEALTGLAPNRGSRWTQQRIEYQSDHRRAVKHIENLELCKNGDSGNPRVAEGPQGGRDSKERRHWRWGEANRLGEPARVEGAPAGRNAGTRRRRAAS